MKHNITLDGFCYRLRPVTLKDAQFIIDVRLEDAERNKFIHTISKDIEVQKQWINAYFERKDDYYFVIENRLTGQPEGLIGLYDINSGKAEWGRWVVKKDSFAAVESVDLIYRIAFERMGLNELYCRTVQNNDGVVSFHNSIGEKTRCVLEKAFEINGSMYNAVEQYADRNTFYSEIHPTLEKKSIMIFKRNIRIAIGDLEFHHIGVASKEIEKDMSGFSFLGYTKASDIFEDKLQGVRGVFLEAKGQPCLELLENLDGSDTVTPMIESGNKMYHFAYMTSNIEKVMGVFLKAKAKIVSPLKQSTFFGKRICFMVLPNMYIIELIEK